MKLKLLLALILTSLALPIFATRLEDNLKIVNYSIGYNLSKIAQRIPATHDFKEGVKDALHHNPPASNNHDYTVGYNFILGKEKPSSKKFRVLPEEIQQGMEDADNGNENRYLQECKPASHKVFKNDDACQGASANLTLNDQPIITILSES